jgi:hypothetical protein
MKTIIEITCPFLRILLTGIDRLFEIERVLYTMY